MYPTNRFRRPWIHDELLAIMPAAPVRVLDVGAGHSPFRVRDHDELLTVDFEPEAEASVTADVASDWPFGDAEFDLIYMSHVIEHFYPPDRDAVIRSVYRSLRPGGLLFIRVPHRSSHQAVGWEHFSLFGLSGVTGLSHGHNPNLPMLRTVSVGASLSMDFYARPSAPRRALEIALSRYWKLTDLVLGHLVLGIAEAQFMLMRMGPDEERRLSDTASPYAL
jgi:SAM-dependent methyltransferase